MRPGALLLFLGLGESDASKGASIWTLCRRHITNWTVLLSSMTGKVISIRPLTGNITCLEICILFWFFSYSLPLCHYAQQLIVVEQLLFPEY